MPKRSLRHEKWFDCDRCGFNYPESQLTTEELTGRRVCTSFVRCLDERPHGEYQAETDYAGFLFGVE